MNNYEVMFIVKIMEEEPTEKMVTLVTDLIAKNGGTVNNVDRMGRKQMAYEVKKMRDGYYVLVEFSIEPEQIKEIDRVIKIHEDIIRHIIVKKDKVAKAN